MNGRTANYACYVFVHDMNVIESESTSVVFGFKIRHDIVVGNPKELEWLRLQLRVIMVIEFKYAPNVTEGVENSEILILISYFSRVHGIS